MMFVGDQGKILAGFHADKPALIPEKRMREFQARKTSASTAASDPTGRSLRDAGTSWPAAFKGGKRTYGDFLLAGPISDAFNLAAVSLRLGGKRLLFDAAKGEVTNCPAAKPYLIRQYRPGWELG